MRDEGRVGARRGVPNAKEKTKGFVGATGGRPFKYPGFIWNS